MSTPSNRSVCSVCRGTKSIEGIGYMKKKCHNCQGLGFVLSVQNGSGQSDTDTIPIARPKKRGRPLRKRINGDNHGKINH